MFRSNSSWQLLSELPDILDRPGAPPLPVTEPGTVGTPAGHSAITINMDEEETVAPLHTARKGNMLAVDANSDRASGEGIEMIPRVHDKDADRAAARGGGVSLDFHDVHFNYPGQAPSQGLKGISFHVAPGSTETGDQIKLKELQNYRRNADVMNAIFTLSFLSHISRNSLYLCLPCSPLHSLALLCSHLLSNAVV